MRTLHHSLTFSAIRMTPDIDRVGPTILKMHTRYREPHEPSLQLSLTFRHLASGNKYASMKFGWRVPHNTILLLVSEVCNARIDEYKNEILACPNTPVGWRTISDN